MNVAKLTGYVNEYAEHLKLSAAYSGSWSDGGANDVLERLQTFKMNLLATHDLRYSELPTMEVGEPEAFNDVFRYIRNKLSQNITL